MELKLLKSMTINTGNYQSIRPAIGVRIETTEENFMENYEKLSDMVERMFQLEVATLYAEQKHLDKIGINKYVNDTFKNSNELMDEIQELTKGIK